MARLGLFVFIIFFSQLVHAERVITIVASDSIPPYVMGNEPLSKELPGLQVELIDQAFSRVGYTTVWKTMPNRRLVLEFRRAEVDAGLNLSTLTSQKVFDSDDVVSYRNCVIGDESLSAQWLKKSHELKILGFQGAAGIFEHIFGPAVLEKNKNYNEVPSQKTIAYHIVNGRTDLGLSDALVFSYYANTYFAPQYARTNLRCLKEMLVPRRLSFKNERLKKIFNDGLSRLRADGSYAAILKKYQERFSMLTKLESSFGPALLPIAYHRGL